MGTFTPGEWKVKYRGYYEVVAGDRLIADCFMSEENARLIAAAPELYEAVCGLLDYAYEALRWADGESETRGKAPMILREIQECQRLIERINRKVKSLPIFFNEEEEANEVGMGNIDRADKVRGRNDMCGVRSVSTQCE